jgi:hypothetical protein
MPRSVLSLVTFAALLAACAAQTGDTSPSTDPSRPARSAPPLATIPQSGKPVTGEVPQAILDAIVADAAERTEVESTTIEVVQAESITWNDGSLGCPEPDTFYTQALVDGYHVILTAGGKELDYRVTAGGGFRLCERDRPGG